MAKKIIEKLAAIQTALKAPKSQYNQFGRYNYRKAEDILEAVKPLLKQHGCALTCSDELILVGDRFYIKATATIICAEDESLATATAFAREEAEKKGMDGSQVTGASSSYARKYALNGLFCIDDTADSDTTNQGDGSAKPAPKKAVKKEQNASSTEVEKPAFPSPIEGLTNEVYLKWLEAIAKGIPTKSGKDANKAFCEKYQPNAEQMERLNDDVFKYSLQNGISN